MDRQSFIIAAMGMLQCVLSYWHTHAHTSGYACTLVSCIRVVHVFLPTFKTHRQYLIDTRMVTHVYITCLLYLIFSAYYFAHASLFYTHFVQCIALLASAVCMFLPCRQDSARRWFEGSAGGGYEWGSTAGGEGDRDNAWLQWEVQRGVLRAPCVSCRWNSVWLCAGIHVHTYPWELCQSGVLDRYNVWPQYLLLLLLLSPCSSLKQAVMKRQH